MAKVIEKSAKTVEDALKAALEELGAKENEVEYEIIEEASKGFLGLIGSKPAKVRVTIKENGEKNTENEKPIDKKIEEKENVVEKDDVKEKIEKKPKDDGSDNKTIEVAMKFLQDVFRDMQLEVKIESESAGDVHVFNVCGENLGILIGKHGQTLDALQYLVNLAANRNGGDKVHFIVDVENYRKRRAETLQNLARNLADRAIRMNQSVKLEPMNRYERKIIHTSLQDDEKVTTYSKGEEPYRYIIISPKK